MVNGEKLGTCSGPGHSIPGSPHYGLHAKSVECAFWREQPQEPSLEQNLEAPAQRLLGMKCIVCDRSVRDHTKEQVKQCYRKASEGGEKPSERDKLNADIYALQRRKPLPYPAEPGDPVQGAPSRDTLQPKLDPKNPNNLPAASPRSGMGVREWRWKHPEMGFGYNSGEIDEWRDSEVEQYAAEQVRQAEEMWQKRCDEAARVAYESRDGEVEELRRERDAKPEHVHNVVCSAFRIKPVGSEGCCCEVNTRGTNEARERAEQERDAAVMTLKSNCTPEQWEQMPKQFKLAAQAISNLEAAYERAERALREIVEALPLTAFGDDVAQHDAADFVDNAGHFFEAMRLAKLRVKSGEGEAK